MSGFWKLYWDLTVFALGACWGSFMNVCIWRIPREESVVRPRSHCPQCEHLITWRDNIPLLSWLLLRGRCRQCGGRISFRYFMVELLTALLFLAIWRLYGPEVRTPLYWLLGFGLLLGTYVDIDHMILPDRVTIGGIWTGLLFSLLFPVLQGTVSHGEGLLRSVIGMALGGGLLWGVAVVGKAIFKKDAMGFGDVKLLAALGAWFGWQSIPFIVFVSSLTGSVAGVALIAVGRKGLQSRIPFGPYIVLAAVIWMLGGFRLWAAYLEAFVL